MKAITHKIRIFLISAYFSLFSILLFSNKPVLLFSDIDSGPKSGWSEAEPEKGVSVSIWGSGFGENRGTSYVTVNGTSINASENYAAWGEYWPTEHFQRITFWLNDQMMDGSGDITVTVDGAESNPLPFTIREGAIYFITENNPGGNGTIKNPYEASNSRYSWVDNMQPGDIYYFRDSDVYDGEYNGGNSVIWIRNSEPSGTETLPIALLGFPGEQPEIAVPTVDVNHSNGIRLSNNHMVFSGFAIDSEWMGANMAGDYHRFVGNDVVGLKNWYGSGTGIIVCGSINTHSGDGNRILGNAIHGGNSQNRYDHGIYISGCADNGGAEVGWNHLYDNDFGRGPIIVINHQENRCEVDQVLDAHFIFNNIVDCTMQRSRAVGVYDLSYDLGEEAPEPTYVYNNIIISCGTFDGENTTHVGYSPAMSQSARGTAHFYNNTLYNSGYIGFRIRENAIESSLKNNIIHMTSEFPGPSGNHYTLIDNESTISLSNNLYYGLGEYTLCNDCVMDQHNINNLDPQFEDEANYNLHLQSSSPAIEVGSPDLEFLINPPSYAPINRDFNYVLRSNAPSIGAYEFTEITSSLNPYVDQNSISIYPNPALDAFTIDVELKIQSKLHIEIYNTMGLLMKRLSPKMYSEGENKIQLDIDNIHSGLYYVCIHAPSSSKIVRKIIVL